MKPQQKGGENVADIERLYRDYYGFIFRFLISKCHNEDLAEELTQETFFRAFINIKKLRDDRKATVWLCQIAKNLLYAWYNEQGKTTPIEDAAELQSAENVAQAVENKALTEEAMRVLKTLDEPYKEVFMLSVFGQVSLKDISTAFGKSESWARVTLYRAKQQIAEGMR